MFFLKIFERLCKNKLLHLQSNKKTHNIILLTKNRKIMKNFLLLFALMASVFTQQAWADTLEKSENETNQVHVYTITSGSGFHMTGKTHPTQAFSEYGYFAFYEVEGEEYAYYIYSVNEKKWLTYESKDSYDAGQDIIKLADEKDDKCYFYAHKVSGMDDFYEFRIADSNGTEVEGWYLNWLYGPTSNKGKSVGLWSDNGAKDDGSRWKLTAKTNEKAPEKIKVSTNESNPEHAFSITGGSGWHMTGKTHARKADDKECGAFAFFAVSGKENAYYIYSITEKKWFTYGTITDNTKDFVQLSDTKNDKCFFYTGEIGTDFEFVPAKEDGEKANNTFLNWNGGANANVSHAVGTWRQGGGADAGSKWTLKALSAEEVGVLTGVQKIAAKGNEQVTYYDLSGRRLNAEPAHGIFIKKGAKTVKVVK